VLNVGAKAAGAASLPTTASRAAGLAITKAASKDLGGHGIRVNAVLTGLVASGQWRRRADAAGQSEDELYRQMARNTQIPLGSVGPPEEFADLAAYLLSDRSSYVTGPAINLDGGTSQSSNPLPPSSDPAATMIAPPGQNSDDSRYLDPPYPRQKSEFSTLAAMYKNTAQPTVRRTAPGDHYAAGDVRNS
jgi:hypothetical protein